MGYATVESLLAEVSHNMTTTNMSRHSRGSVGQKSGPPMRVVKPSSANNSPRNSAVMGRRMTDGAYRRRMALLEQGARDTIPLTTNHGLQISQHLPLSRPVSWHPASQVPQNYSTYVDSTYQMYDVQPSPIVYSSYNSPTSTFSTLSGPIYGYEQQHYIPQVRHSYHPTSYTQQQINTLPLHSVQQDQEPMYAQDWNYFAAHGFGDSSTTPPTPENFLPIQHPEPSLQEDSIPYQPLDDTDDGEELIGLGLYDTPETKSSHLDPQLDNYRALMMAQMMGTPYRRPEPVGKGLKLEETWAPPATEDDEDSDRDGDGDAEEEEEEEKESSVVETVVPQSNLVVQPHYATYPSQPEVYTYGGATWF